MTASDVLTYLETRRVRLALAPEGQLLCRAPRGILTMVLQGTIKTCKEPLTTLLTSGEDTPVPTGVSLPELDYSRFVTWQTGKVPVSATPMEKLPPPTYHDVPSAPETVLGRPCPKKGCKPDATFTSGQPASMYYRRTRLCVACYGRLKKGRLVRGEEAQGGEDHALPGTTV
jgi:hypothetical protein